MCGTVKEWDSQSSEPIRTQEYNQFALSPTLLPPRLHMLYVSGVIVMAGITMVVCAHFMEVKHAVVLAAIPLFFYLCTLGFMMMYKWKGRKNAGSLLRLYLSYKAVKFILSIIIMGGYAFAQGQGGMAFELAFGAYFLLFLGVETSFFLCFEQKIKEPEKYKRE